MITEARNKIETEIKSIHTTMATILGKYLLSAVTNDLCAAEVLNDSRSIKDFCEKVSGLAEDIHRNKFKDMEMKAITAKILEHFGADASCEVTEGFTAEMYILTDPENTAKGVMPMTSDVIIPLLHAYFHIPLSGVNADQPSKPAKFRRVSLD